MGESELVSGEDDTMDRDDEIGVKLQNPGTFHHARLLGVGSDQEHVHAGGITGGERTRSWKRVWEVSLLDLPMTDWIFFVVLYIYIFTTREKEKCTQRYKQRENDNTPSD